MSVSPTSPTGQTILVIEDDDAARVGLVAILSPHGYLVAVAPTGQAALGLLAHGLNPSLILLDMLVPGLDGWQFLAGRQKDQRLAAIPVVIMTGLPIASEEWATSLGAAGLLRKPIAADLLLDAVRRHALGQPATS